MDEKIRLVGTGILFYTSIYINIILLAVSAMTGRWIFILLIVLTLGLTAYMMLVLSQHSSHLEDIGNWVEQTIFTNFKKLKTSFNA